MLGVTLFGIFLTPVFYVLLRGRRALHRPVPAAAAQAAPPLAGTAPLPAAPQGDGHA